MKFKEFICFKATIPALKATDRDGAISELVSALAGAGKLTAGSQGCHEGCDQERA